MTTMTNKPLAAEQAARRWREALTADEAEQLAPIESRIDALRDELLILNARRHRIQNRASVRAGKVIAAPKKKGKR